MKERGNIDIYIETIRKIINPVVQDGPPTLSLPNISFVFDNIKEMVSDKSGAYSGVISFFDR